MLFSSFRVQIRHQKLVDLPRRVGREASWCKSDEGSGDDDGLDVVLDVEEDWGGPDEDGWDLVVFEC